MTATAFFALIVGIVRAIPIFAGWFDQFVAYYTNQRIDEMSAENLAAIKTAIQQKDQRDLEKVLGNPNAGEPSNVGGTVIRNDLPGVHN